MQADKYKKTIVKIAVLQSGKIMVDGKVSSIEEVRNCLSELALKNGVVWYYREASRSEPPPEATKVIDIVIEKKLSISFSGKPDYSDYIDENGQSHPRK